MDLDLIEKLMRMLEQSGLQELDVNDGGTRIRLAKKRTLGLESFDSAREPDIAPSPEPVPQGPHRIVSGMTGTFYRASGPGVAPYVTETSGWNEPQQDETAADDWPDMPAESLVSASPGTPLATFLPSDGAITLRVAPVAGFQGLMRIQDALTHLPTVRHASVEAYSQGEARLRIELTDPSDSDELAEGLARIVGDAPLRATVREAGLARVGRYGWDACVSKTVGVYRRACAA